MMYLLAILVPPLAILFAGRPFQAVFNFLLWVLGLVLLVMPFVPGLLTWAIAVGWAVLVVRNRRMEERDRRLVEDAVVRQRMRRASL
ncbi:hypothetical protein [Caldovatus aquaticus]|uniref:YqaE/Pmp3 family membrane protein n=1 Tax=Caldovatus aquaticus TaxID=2865671 RepID=A0ABS7F2Y7_9PROT|nr:hypothetical protein [Caldovatus aquaticus]MBW8269967.1 hypothetical protein [Caldovatus aquaticus]